MLTAESEGSGVRTSYVEHEAGNVSVGDSYTESEHPMVLLSVEVE